MKNKNNESVPAIFSEQSAEKIAGKVPFSRILACLAGKIQCSRAILFLFLLVFSAQAQTPYYYLNRSFSSVQFDLQGIPTEYLLNEESDKLTDIVQGEIKTNDCYAIEKQTAIAIGYGSALSAWNAVVNYTGSTSTYSGKIFDNVGWVRGTKSAGTNWGAYLWVLQNRIAFQASTSAWWSTTNGIPVAITNVMVGSLGDYQATNNVVDIGPVIPSNFPDANDSDSGTYQVDITNVYYVLVIPDIWITPRDAVAAVDGSNVQFTVTGTNIPTGVTWSLIPDLSGSGGATIPSNGAWQAEVMPGNIATNYIVRATSKVYTNFYDQVSLTVLKVDITPSAVNATESLDSGTFTCTVTPSGLSPTYQWLTGSDNDAWPATAGNDPELDYSASTASATIVNGTRWFAPTPCRSQAVDGVTCDYSVNCEVTVGGTKCRASTPATLSVTVDMTGQTTGCVFQSWDTITVAQTGGVWNVTGQSNFSRSAPAASVNMPATSQFHDKAMVHENKHVEQWMTGMFKDLKDANALYNSTLSTLTSTNSEADLRDKILYAVWAKSVSDDEICNSKTCDAEEEAFDAMNAVDPDFLELDDADWKPLYGCQ